MMGSRYASSKQAVGMCDRCGFRFRIREMRELIVKTKKTNTLVCRECWEPDHPQLQLGMYPIDDPQAIRTPRPDTSYIQAGVNAVGLNTLGNRVLPTGLPVNNNTNELPYPSNFDAGWIRTNLFDNPNGVTNTPLYNATFLPVAWGTSTLTRTNNAGLAPDGTSTAVLLVKNSTANVALASIPIALENYGTTTAQNVSIYVLLGPQVQNGVCSIRIGTFSLTASAYATFNLLLGTVNTVGITGTGFSTPVGAVYPIGNGIYRISFSTAYVATNERFRFYFYPASYPTDTTNPQSCYVWGAQLTPAGTTLYPFINNYDQNVIAAPYVNATKAPDGTLTAQTIYPDHTNGYHYLSTTFTQKSRFLFGVCAKQRGITTLRVQNAANTVGATFDLASGKARNVVGTYTTPVAQYIGNGWFECTVLSNGVPTSDLQLYIGDTQYVGNGLNGMALWGAWVSGGEEPYYGLHSDTWWMNALTSF